MSYTGIDYGLGRSNIDTNTGIRYGVISQNSVLQAWADSSEAEYGEPTCGHCGNTAIEASQVPEDADWREEGYFDYACLECKRMFDSEDAFGEEPIGYSYSGEGYELTDCLDTDVFVLKSPYYTFAQFCSPCVPGAGNLDTPITDGIKTYCLGHDWFEEGKAPYPVYSVETGELVQP